jgi:hypothetical protein
MPMIRAARSLLPEIFEPVRVRRQGPYRRLLGAPGTEELLTTLEQDAISAGATVHWGQRNDLTMVQVETMFDPTGPSGALFRWRQALSAFSQHGRFKLLFLARCVGLVGHLLA